ncbi:MAG: hypothetical protein GY824_14970, partial [Delftia sp.]|nr:hypothetical protein [Delftia sp.]
LAEAIAMMFKTFRTAGVGVWVAEQNLLTLLGLGGQGGQGSGKLDVVSGRYVMENARFYVILAQQPEGVGAVRSHFPQVTESHLLTLQGVRAARGRGIVVLPDGVYTLNIRATPVELELLGGS